MRFVCLPRCDYVSTCGTMCDDAGHVAGHRERDACHQGRSERKKHIVDPYSDDDSSNTYNNLLNLTLLNELFPSDRVTTFDNDENNMDNVLF